MTSIAGDPGTDSIRQMAARVAEEASDPRYDELRQLWWKHNSLIKDRPMVLCRPVSAWGELVPVDSLISHDPVLRQVERLLRMKLWKIEIADDDIAEPWVTLDAAWADPCPYHDMWGPHVELKRTGDRGGTFTYTPAVASEEDFALLRVPDHRIDEAATALLHEKAEEAVAGVLPVRLNRVRRRNFISLANTASYLFGLDALLHHMVERPEWVHRMMAFLRDGTMARLDYLEREGLLHLNNGGEYVGSGGFGWSRELPQADFDGRVRTKDLWGMAESQETVGVSPAMFGEFVYPYQLPLLARFGLNCYGCCEPVHSRWHIIRDTPNLRRVSVSPWCDVADIAEKLQHNYILSMKPNPARLADSVFDEDLIRRELREDLERARGCCIEIIMKDCHTIGKDPRRVCRWVELAREESERIG